MSKFSKHSAQLASGIGLLAISRGMKDVRKNVEQQTKLAQEQSAQYVQQYEYVFYEPAVKDVITVVDEMTEIILANGYQIDPIILAKAKNILDVMNYALSPEG